MNCLNLSDWTFHLISEITVSRKRGQVSVFAAAVQFPEVVR